MTQTARPISDVLNEGWTPGNVYEAVNDPSPNTSSPAESPNNPQGKAFEVLLRSLQWPERGNQKLTVQLKRIGTEDIWATVEFLQGSKLLGMEVVENPSEYQNIEISNPVGPPYWITDYTDLRVRVTASTRISTSCCPNPIAPLLKATLSNKTGDAVDLDNEYLLTYRGLTWYDGLDTWLFYGDRPACLNDGQPLFQLAIACWEEGWVLPAHATWYDQGTKVSEQCDPFKLVYDVNLLQGTGCDSGSFRVTVTE